MNTRMLMPCGLLLVSGMLLGCSSAPSAPELTQCELTLVSSSNQFAFGLFGEVIAKSNGGNVFISPLSVSMALGMTFNGSAGTTQQAMKDTLGFTDLSELEINEGYRTLIDYLTLLDPKVTMEIANSIWYRQGLEVLQAFIDANLKYFDALIRALDFNDYAAADTINEWVSAKTHRKIDGIVEKPIDPALVMFLVNAVYFKGDWTFRFDKANTRAETFHAPAGDKTVQMMNLHSDKLAYFETPEFQAIDLLYGNGSFAMALLLPAPGKSVNDLTTLLSGAAWTDWMGRFNEEEGDVALPRFELEFKTSLKEVLISLGMEVAFNDFEADFTRIRAEGGLAISDVKHKTYLKVNEEGTEAAAVTSVEIKEVSIPETFSIRLDRPFLLVIHDRASKALLFMGMIVDPKSE